MAKKKLQNFISGDIKVLIKQAEEAIKESEEADERLIRLFL